MLLYIEKGDVNKDATDFYEENEFILMLPFNTSGLKLIKDGGMNFLGFYSENNIPIYSIKLKADKLMEEEINFDELLNEYYKLCNDISVYGKLIEDYLNDASVSKMIYDLDYRSFAKRIQNLYRKLQIYINYCIKNDKDVKKLILR